MPKYSEVDWEQAACRGLPTNFFYRIEEQRSFKVVDSAVIRGICLTCPIWDKCLAYAAENEDYGVWGGMLTEERRSLVDDKKLELRLTVLAEFADRGITRQMVYEAIGDTWTR